MATMDEGEAAAIRTGSSWGLASKVVVGFWALHLLYRLAIGFVGHSVEEMFDPALDTALAVGFIASFGFCGLLMLAARRGLGFALGVTALLSLPASIVYAAVELSLFYYLSPRVNGGSSSSTLPDGTVVTVTASGDVSYAKPGGGKPTRVKLPTPKQLVRDRALQTITENTTGWFFFYFGLGSFFVGMIHASRLRQSERRIAEFQRLAQQAQLEALRYQINPHFLFNTLNSLSALIMAGRIDPAETMILNLSHFFRAMLSLDPAGDVTLRRELELQRLYLDIEEVRFPDRLKVSVDLADEVLEASVPALLLQPLVENAVKHGVARSTGMVTIAITAQLTAYGQVELVVANDLSGHRRERSDEGTGTGLRNVERRLLTRFGEQASCRAEQLAERFVVTLVMPLEVA